MTPKHLFSVRTLSKEDLESIFELALSIEKNPEKFADVCKGKIMATMFFEPSTRTRLSFESAMLRLGGKILGFTSAKVSSAAKGESIADTIRMINGYAHIAVIRHFMEGIGEITNEYASIPFISGGTGTQEHPTQAILDLYTIKKEFGDINGLTIGIMGDLKYGRTVPSLLLSLMKYEGVKIKLISPPALRIRKNVELRLQENKCDYVILDSVNEVIDELDVLYVTRIQKERFPDPTDYERLKGAYSITPNDLINVKENFILLHPLPRVTEISYGVDKLNSAKFFEQAQNGVWARMALIIKYLEEK